MKLTAFLILVCCMHVAARTHAQTVTLDLKNASLEKVFTEIRKQTGFNFLFSSEDLQKAKPVTISVTNSSVQEVLSICLKDQPFSFTIQDNNIVIKQKLTLPNEQTTTEPNPPIDITGRITNAQGEPLAGANIILKRTGRGTIADANGNFKLNNVNNDDVIIVSFIGYKPLNIKVGDRSNFTLIMDLAVDPLDKVVVQAYGKTSDRLRTGNISKVTSEDISKQPVMNVLNVLQGQIPGAVVTNSSGYASGTIKVEIRGRNTINSSFSADPLYIIDGVPLTILDVTGSDSYNGGSSGIIRSGITSPASGQSPLFSINPGDIESIEVLKDADATAIYGSRGSNGVILITTKKGKAGKTKFDLNVYQGLEKITTRYDVLNTQQYVQMRKEALANDGLPLNLSTAPELVKWDTTRNTDWQKFLFGGTGKTTDVEGNLSGGNNQTTFRLGTAYHYQSDILAISGANKRGTVSFNLNHKSVNQHLGLTLSSLYSYSSINIIASPGNALILPNAPDVYDSKGNLNYAGWTPLDNSYPFASILQPYESKTNFLNSKLDLNYEIIKGLVFRTSFGYGELKNSQINLTTIASQNPRFNPQGQALFGYSFVRNWIIEPQVEYTHFIGANRLNFLIGASQQSNLTSGIGEAGAGYSNDVLMTSINNAPNIFVQSVKGEYKYAGLFGRINYNFKDKYILNFNARRDGSSRFGPGKQYGNFGSIGAAWIFTTENWIKEHLQFLSFGKIRGSYGLTGGDQISDYAYLSRWGFSTNSTYNGIVPLIATRHTDSTLQWQVNKKAEVSISLGFFHDRINLELDFYRNRCNNQLVQFPLPAFTGFSSVTSNSPANVQNTGQEFILNTKPIDYKNFNWNIRFNISRNRNKLLSYPNFSQSPYVSSLAIGESLNIIKLLHYIGVDPQTGLYKFEDKNKDGNITVDVSGKTPDDRYNLDRSVKFEGGINNTFSYKNWELSVFFYFRKQLGFNAFAFTPAGGAMKNQPLDVFLNHWQKPGDIAQYAKFTTNPGSDVSYQYFFQFSDGKFTDASFIRMQNLLLSFSLPEKVFKKAGINNFKIYIKGQNLLLLTKYKGSDPELQTFGGVPMPKVITAGLSCNF